MTPTDQFLADLAAGPALDAVGVMLADNLILGGRIPTWTTLAQDVAREAGAGAMRARFSKSDQPPANVICQIGYNAGLDARVFRYEIDPVDVGGWLARNGAARILEMCDLRLHGLSEMLTIDRLSEIEARMKLAVFVGPEIFVDQVFPPLALPD